MKNFNTASLELGKAITDFLEAYKEETSRYPMEYSEENIGDITIEAGGLVAPTRAQQIASLKDQLSGNGYYFIWTNWEDLCFAYLTGVPGPGATDEEIESWLNLEYFNLISLVKEGLPYRAFTMTFKKLFKLEYILNLAIETGKFNEKESKAIIEGEVLLSFYDLASVVANKKWISRAVPTEICLAKVVADSYREAIDRNRGVAVYVSD